ncbi:MAG: 2-oxoacid:acceptor oxidoreductase family protein [Clostridiales bacterium]|jgi:2-oxoglutarate ferredoxin oxidoreductase subunit gamma|nr:2-oxoacid:acceptor oxidoreductase family protein [Clostridiales bacterium]
MLHEIIMAGFGGQGVLSMGKLLAEAALSEDKHVSWLPSYGPEMRGGTANCNVVLAQEEVSSPIVSRATSVIVMNKPSLDKFEKAVIPGGILIINSSLIDRKSERDDIKAYYVPANTIAGDLGNPKVANVVMLGAFLALTSAVKTESLEEIIEENFKGKKASLIEINKKALAAGMASIE